MWNNSYPGIVSTAVQRFLLKGHRVVSRHYGLDASDMVNDPVDFGVREILESLIDWNDTNEKNLLE